MTPLNVPRSVAEALLDAQLMAGSIAAIVHRMIDAPSVNPFLLHQAILACTERCERAVDPICDVMRVSDDDHGGRDE